MPAASRRIQELWRDYDVLLTPAIGPAAGGGRALAGSGRAAHDQRDVQRLSLRRRLELHRTARRDDPRRLHRLGPAALGDDGRAAERRGDLDLTRRPARGGAALGRPPARTSSPQPRPWRRASTSISCVSAAISIAPFGPPSSVQRSSAVSWKRSRKSSECSGSWWKSIRRRASTRRAKVRVSVSFEWPQPTCSGYSSSVYWQSWISRSASRARSKPEIHSGSRVSRAAPSPGSWSEM